MVRHSRAALLLFSLCLALRGGDFVSAADAGDLMVVPGKRVGPITAYSSLAVLEALYGRSFITPKMQLMPNGDTTPGARLFAGTERHLDLLWEDDGREKRVSEVRILGRDWMLENGVRVGQSVAEVEKLTGKIVHASGADAIGGALAVIEGPAPGSSFGVRYVISSGSPKKAQEPIKTKAKAKKPATPVEKKPAPNESEVRAGDATVTQIVIWLH